MMKWLDTGGDNKTAATINANKAKQFYVLNFIM